MNTAKETYAPPQVEAVELKLERAVLTISDLSDYEYGGDL